MKSILKKTVAIILSVMLVFAFAVSSFAVTIYYYFGYSYTYINDELVSLYGIEEGTEYLFIPDTLNNRKLVDIRNYAFMNNKEITGLDFAGATNLERIGMFAFANCENISGGISIPANVTTIESAAFQNCTSLESVVYDGAINYVPNQCFNGCTNLRSITLGENVTSIGHYAFNSCPNLTYMVIPGSVTEISDYAFSIDSNIQLGVYYDTAAYHYAIDKGMSYVVLDPENIPVVPTEPVTEPTEAPTEPVTETPEPTEAVTEQPTEALKLLLGDADGDGMVDITDATIIQRVLANINVEKYDALASDVDGNGEVDIIDVTFIMRYCSQIPTAYSIGEWIDR